uniref:Uncharacterized protein n=1 Tax=Myoviridae sp. ct0f722 TaxID=2827599 RepID=A0A8S5LPM7_9CAUD|nr:MAG TPA: hypothetical protein [Myoviridae sp. ct0f722]
MRRSQSCLYNYKATIFERSRAKINAQKRNVLSFYVI